jgi:hypothetical protein
MWFGTTAGVVLSAVVTALGIFVALASAGSDIALFGWFLAVLGVLFVLVNLLLRGRT